MSILNITNLTDNPEKLIRENYLNAFEEYEKEKGIKIDDDEKFDFIDTQIDSLEEQMEEAQGKELLGIIDNYLINFDYYYEVKEWYHNNKI
jgi:hypothetical protein